MPKYKDYYHSVPVNVGANLTNIDERPLESLNYRYIKLQKKRIIL